MKFHVQAHVTYKTRYHIVWKFDYLARADEMWSIGYFVSTVGTNERMIKNYIQNQEKQDKGRSEIVLEDDTTGEA